MKSLLALLLLATLAYSAPVKFAWNAPPASEGVVVSHLREKLPNGTTEFLVASTTQEATVDLSPGTHVVIACAMNVFGWSGFSDPVTVTVEQPVWRMENDTLVLRDGTKIDLVIQFSSNLKEWTDRPSPAARFFRVQATINP